MRLKTALTKKDIVIVLACLIFLVINVGTISSGGRKRAKRTICLTNLRQLTLAWTQFANDNDGFIVNGAAGINRPNDPPWIGSFFSNGPEAAIKSGALWPYCQELKLYRCPIGYAREVLNYAIVDSMNGMARSGTLGEPGVYITNRMQIATPHNRIVFIDQGWVTPDCFAVYYVKEGWWDDPPVRHGDGTAQSFADGHSEWHRWKGKWTVARGKTLYGGGHSRPGDPINGKFIPATIDDFHDLYWTQIGCWGKLGYTPSYP